MSVCVCVCVLCVCVSLPVRHHIFGTTRQIFIIFLPRDAMHPRYYSHGPVSIRLSVRPSQVGVLLKRLNVGSHKQHHTIPQGL